MRRLAKAVAPAIVLLPATALRPPGTYTKMTLARRTPEAAGGEGG